MSTRDFIRAAAGVRGALWVIGVLTLLTFPLQRVHQASSHFRAHEVRRSFVRHTLLARSPEASTAQVSDKTAVSFSLLLKDREDHEPSIETATVPTVPITLLLTRLKLGPSRSSGQEPPL